MVTAPALNVVASPDAEITPTVLSLDCQVTLLVRLAVLPSENCPVAVNCTERPAEIEGFTGVMEIETRVAPVTVRLVIPVTPFWLALILVGPTAAAVTRPVAFTVAAAVEDCQVAVEVRSNVLPSEKKPVALYCWVVPSGSVLPAGVTTILVSVAAVTFNVGGKVSLIPFTVALTTVLPTLVPVAKPVVVMVATPPGVVLHVATLVRSTVLPSEKVPVAVNCSCAPIGKSAGGSGVTVTACRVALVTLNVVEPEMLVTGSVAVIRVEPGPVEVARPGFGAGVVAIVATVPNCDPHVTVLVMSKVLPSENVPSAVNCCVKPLATEGSCGRTSIERKTGAVAETDTDPRNGPLAATMRVVPCECVVTRPVLSTVATAGDKLLHTAPTDCPTPGFLKNVLSAAHWIVSPAVTVPVLAET